ncbi:transposase, partial [Candidatus Bipolaricaulota bacterium]|nr:transposase [Candidatus Bipolaricaulota bacterium]
GSLYETFPPVLTKALWHRFEFVYTQKHSSWLNIAEIEINVLIRQCLNRRIDTLDEMQATTSAWEKLRNNAQSSIDWQFTTYDALIKLRPLYPTLTM